MRDAAAAAAGDGSDRSDVDVIRDVLAGNTAMFELLMRRSAADLRAVVDHYDKQLGLNLSEEQRLDLVEYLKSL